MANYQSWDSLGHGALSLRDHTVARNLEFGSCMQHPLPLQTWLLSGLSDLHHPCSLTVRRRPVYSAPYPGAEYVNTVERGRKAERR